MGKNFICLTNFNTFKKMKKFLSYSTPTCKPNSTSVGLSRSWLCFPTEEGRRKKKEGRKKNPHLTFSRWIDPTCLNFGDCIVGVWRVSVNCLEGVWRLQYKKSTIIFIWDRSCCSHGLNLCNLKTRRCLELPVGLGLISFIN